jgi:hypothetical protein
VRSFSTSFTSDFSRRRVSMATRHLRGEYSVCSGMSVSRASSSGMVSLKDPAYHVPK